MSASDAAPLPRLGEVFFDVRGDSRSMRLSWYADTGIAVFSIWQGGRCTGTFRLPMEDLARMTEILRRGPQRRRGGPGREHERGDYEPAGYDEAGYGEGQYDEGQYHDSEYDQGQNDQGQYDRGQYDQGQYDQGQYDEGRYDDDWFDGEGSRGGGGHRADERELTGGYPDRPRANRPSAGHDS